MIGELPPMPRLVVISDTHGLHEGFTLPYGDILIHAGDMTEHGSLRGVRAFDQWLGRLPHPKKIVIAGNHDFCFEDESAEARSSLTNGIYLEDEAVMVDGLKFWGSPWTPKFFDWAFMRQPGEEMRNVWAQIPADTDILITHGPPKGRLDLTEEGERAGCVDLLEAVRRTKPKVHIFGHIHEGRGIEKQEGVTFINASSVSTNYRRLYPPFVLEV